MEAEEWNRPAIVAVRVLAMTGRRISELPGLRWADLRPDRCEALLVDTRTGTRWASIPAEALALLDGAPKKPDNAHVFVGRKKGRPLSYNAVADALTEACKRAGVERVSPQVFRASAATAMAEAGASVFRDSPFGSRTGRPVIPHQVAVTLGDSGDLMLVDLGEYLTAIKAGGLRAETSIHLWFDQDLTAFRFIVRVAGQPWWSEAATSRDGSFTQSPFVVLAARA